MHQLLKSYLKRLTNLSTQNKGIFLPKPYSGQQIDFHDFDFLEGQNSFALLSEFLKPKGHVKLCSVIDSRMESVNVVSKKLREIARTDRKIKEERGVHELHIAWPFVKGKLLDDSLIRCPLLYIPVELNLAADGWYLKRLADASITFNKNFLFTYAYRNGIQLTNDLIECDFENFDEDSRVFRTELYSMIKESPLELHFNQELFIDELRNLIPYTLENFKSSFETGKLKCYPEAALGLFPINGSYLVPDYLSLLEENETLDLEDFFMNRSVTNDQNTEASLNLSMPNFLSEISEDRMFNCFPLDIYQENALKAAKKGNSLVIQGPPGTGKSQLICNLAADFMARGKRVLIVCQKKAALDVVYERMHEVGASLFLGRVHDFKKDRAQLYSKVNQQIEKLQEYKMNNISLDIIQLERSYTQTCNLIDQHTELLEAYRKALFDTSECGLSVKELYLTSDPRAEQIAQLKPYLMHLSFDKERETKEWLQAYFEPAFHLKRESHPWFFRNSFADFENQDEQQIIRLLQKAKIQVEEYRQACGRVVNTHLSTREIEALEKKKDNILSEMFTFLRNEGVFYHFKNMCKYSSDGKDLLWLKNLRSVFNSCFSGGRLETSLKKEDLGKTIQLLEEGKSAGKSPIKWLQWKYLGKKKNELKEILKANKLTYDKAGIEELISRLDNRLNLEHNITLLKNKDWLSDFPTHLSFNQWNQWFNQVEDALRAKEIFHSVRGLKAYFDLSKITLDTFKNKLSDLILLSIQQNTLLRSWKRYLSTHQIEEVIERSDCIEAMITSLEDDFELMRSFDSHHSNLLDWQLEVIEKLEELTTDRSLDSIYTIFDNSLRIAWIDYLESKYPDLTLASGGKIEKKSNELRKAVKEKSRISQKIVLMRLKEQTYADLEYNRLNNLVTYRDLKHQVSKKRNIWPLRKLIDNYAEELFKLVPCWLASPETVSAVFPMKQVFDLVIFDEASQCFVEKGIPAMYRAKQVIVAGDSKQLKPYDLYKVRWQEEEIDSLELEVDSLLELGEKYMMNTQLRGHYRSKDPALISFSNQHFYDNQLESVPDKTVMDQGHHAYKFHLVDGIWENNSNLKEAETVVGRVLQIHEEEDEKSIGIVTFNLTQAQLIEDLLETHITSKHLRDRIFVKNIENVQGDETDIIIFSTAYAVDTHGKMHTKFGSLNMQGGENRLNVAITRARERIELVTSIVPEQLKVENTAHSGPKLLKLYLQFVKDYCENNENKSAFYTNSQLPYTSMSHQLSDRISKEFNQISSKENLKLQKPMGMGDIQVVVEDHLDSIISCDDNDYKQCLGAKDFHAYRPLLLSSKGWKNIIVYSRQYWKNKNKMFESLEKFILR
ncbi:MAG: DUF4011 domain-containing protein [Cyclobacteriaceae bacterium]|nr:DUF4011 domain-containing protein [Cyclobacteriaceae bacterium]MCH8514727.1 DUF4011 domain-containing protein [Cyclobacteriaceae bacterium]